MLTVMERMISLNSNHVEHIKELLSVNPQWGAPACPGNSAGSGSRQNALLILIRHTPSFHTKQNQSATAWPNSFPFRSPSPVKKRKITSCSTACYRNIIIWDTEALSGKASNILSAIPSPARWPAFCLAPRHGKPRRGTSSSDGRAAGAKAICLL